MLTVSPAVLLSIAVTPANPSIAQKTNEQFTADGTFSDNSTENLTSQVTWASATTSVATITAAGLATGVASGTSAITATLDGVTASTVLTVTDASLLSIAVTPASPSVPKGETEQFTATGTFSDNSTQNLTSQVTWASATTSVATITAAGLATGAATGPSTISASLDGVTGSTVLTVSPAALLSIAVSPATPSITQGGTEQFTAIGTFSDNSTQNLTNQVTWASATTSVATITSGGLASGMATGNATIIATLDGITVSTVLTVDAPPAPPLVTLTNVQLVLNKRHLVTEILVTFSGEVDAAEAVEKGIYRLAEPGKHNSFTAKNAPIIKLKKVVYNAANATVTLTPRTAFSLSKPVQISINGQPTSGLEDSVGRLIDGDDNGQPGGNAVAVLSRNRVTLNAVAAVSPAGVPSLDTAAVDAVLGHIKP